MHQLLNLSFMLISNDFDRKSCHEFLHLCLLIFFFLFFFYFKPKDSRKEHKIRIHLGIVLFAIVFFFFHTFHTFHCSFFIPFFHAYFLSIWCDLSSSLYFFYFHFFSLCLFILPNACVLHRFYAHTIHYICNVFSTFISLIPLLVIHVQVKVII